MVVYTGKVEKWMADRGYGFIISPSLPSNVLVHFTAFGGGNLIVGKEVDFEIDTASPQLKVRKLVGDKGINYLWMDTEGRVVNWKTAYTRELARIRYVESRPPSNRPRWTFLDTKFLTSPEEPDVAFKKMIGGRQSQLQAIKVALPMGARVCPDSFAITFTTKEEADKAKQDLLLGKGILSRFGKNTLRHTPRESKHPRDRGGDKATKSANTETRPRE